MPLAARPAFSSDGRWLAYSITVSETERTERERAGETVRSGMGLLDLRSGTTTAFDDIASFDFSGDGAFLLMRSYDSEGAGHGVNTVVRRLATAEDRSFAGVSSAVWQHDGSLLAMVTRSGAGAADGVHVFAAQTGVLRTLVADSAEYTGLVWRKDADDIAVLRVHRDSAFADATHSVLAWRNVRSARPRGHVLDAETRAGIGAARRIVELRPLRWSADGETLFFGVRERRRAPVPTANDAERAGVAVWHSYDVEIVPEQRVRAGIEASRSELAAWHLPSDRVVQLGGVGLDDVALSDGHYAIGLHAQPYERERMFGPVQRDLYVIDMRTGERTRVVERVQFHYGISPGGRYIVYVRDDDFWSYDTDERQHRNITTGVATTFINREHDLTLAENPPYGTGGWTADDRGILLHDRYDLWEVRLDGSGATNLTLGAADRVRHRRVWLDPDQRVVDLAEPVYVTLHGERSKQYGYGRLRPGAPAERLVFLDSYVSRLTKAADADVYMYRLEAFDDSPDVFVGGPQLADARQLTHTNPFQSGYAWGRSEIISFVSAAGDSLQAGLLYPANHVPGRMYPLIVDLYERTSHTVHTYTVPSEYTAQNATVFTQNGYFVLRPDIVFRGRDPGLSSLEALLPAVERVLATGLVDRGRIGLIGHSWGGYQTAFAVTQTDMFRAAVAGAPLTNLFSMYLSIYWNTGSANARMFEIDQGRMEVPFWEDIDAYVRNSPVFHIQRLNTPLLVAFGDRDGAVDWHQGIELYNAARRAGRQLVLLVYEGENHSLAQRPNQRDYHRRTNEWFGHYLKGEPAPEWITGGPAALTGGPADITAQPGRELQQRGH